ncbi:3'-5' exoribonuclease [Candidatus Pelagibacter sp.]|nr:3'-5' exoribonuclease [Candidatus Pelagibacter sp.]
MQKNKKFVDVFLDTEFTTAGMNSQLISLGMVSENNDKLYIEFNFNKKFLTPWLKKNVVTKLKKKPLNKSIAKKKLENWFNKIGKEKKIRLISAGKEMDNLLLYSLWTSKKLNSFCWRYKIPHQINHTSHIDMMTLLQVNKIDSTIDRLKFSGIKKITMVHQSLNDAIILKKCLEKLKIKC